MRLAVKLFTLIAIPGFLLGAVPVLAEVEQSEVKVDADGAERIVLDLEFGAGEIWINSSDQAEAAIFDITYDTRSIEYHVDYEVRNGTGWIEAKSNMLEDTNLDTEANEWRIDLSTRYPLAIEIKIGACDAEFDLGGLMLEKLDLEVGAASAAIEFSRRNETRLREIRIEAGAASLDMRDVGNANFDLFEFEGGAGSFDLDFRGEYRGKSEIVLEVGFGSVDIVLPDDVPVRIVAEEAGFLSSVEVHGRDLRYRDDSWESDDYESAETRILVRLDVGVGSTDINFK